MPIDVGGVQFEGGEGAAYSPLSAAQIDSYAAAIQTLRIGNPPPTSQGELSVWSDVTEYDGNVLLSSGTRLIGSRVTVDLGFGTPVTDVTVAAFSGNWLRKRGVSNGGIFEGRFVFDSSADKDGGDEQTVAKVQTATVWGTWIDRPTLKCFETSEGVGTYAGEGTAETKGLAPIDIVGHWVRVLDAGDVPRFHGKVSGRSVQGSDQEQSATVTYEFTGIAGAFDQMAIVRWFEWSGDGTPWLTGSDLVTDPGDVLPFNGIISGDSTTDEKTIAVGVTAKIHARGQPGVQSNRLEMLQSLLKYARAMWPYGPLLAVGGQTSLLSNLRTSVDPRGLTFLQALAAIVDPNDGVTWRFDVSGSTVTILIRSTNSDNPGAQAVDLTSPEVSEWATGVDETNRAERIYVAAPRPQWCSSFAYLSNKTGQFLGGWADADVATWTARTGEAKDAPDTAMVYRRFILDPQWDGGTDTSPARVLPFTRQTDATGQETGELLPGEPWPNARVAVQLLRTLPIGKGRDWSAAYGKINTGDEQEGPLAFAVKGSTWIPLHFQMQVQIGDDQASVILGRDWNDAVLIKQYLDDDHRLVFTLGWQHPRPWRVSWVRDDGLGNVVTTVDLPRSVLITRTDEALQQILMDSGTVVGLNSSGAPLYGDNNAGRIDGNDSLALVRLKLRFAEIDGVPTGSCSYQRSGHDVMSPDPADYITQATVPITSTLSSSQLVNAVVGRRTINYTRGATSVSWQASRLIGGVGRLVKAINARNLNNPAVLLAQYKGGL